jgi:hypothetical protein
MPPPGYSPVNLLRAASSIVDVAADPRFPASRVADDRPGRLFKTTGPTMQLEAQWLSSQLIDLVGVVNLQGPDLDSGVVEYWTGSAWASLGTLAAYGNAWWRFGAVSTTRVRLIVSDGGGGPIGLGVLHVGRCTQLSRGWGVGAGAGRDYLNSGARSAFGAPNAHNLSEGRVWDATWRGAMDAAQRAELESFIGAGKGGALPMLWLPDAGTSTSSGTDCAVARVEQASPRWSYVGAWDRFAGLDCRIVEDPYLRGTL